MTQQWRTDADAYLAVQERYRAVGRLVTEQFHPKTTDLALWAQSDLPRGYAAIKEVDMDALRIFLTKTDELERLTRAVRDTLHNGGNIITYAMGSPYRASFVNAHTWSQLHKGTALDDRLRAYGTGGDVSLIVPVKGVEDRPDYGAGHIRESGLRRQDLCMGYVEGGETPSVLGAITEAATITDQNVHFAYCNPDHLLRQIPDVAMMHDNPKIDRYSLAVGPMALAGSTRMQATTILQLMTGAALFGIPMDEVQRFVDYIESFDYAPFIAFTEAETEAYKNGEYTLYRAREYAVTVSSNTTELCPTFNLKSFEGMDSDTYLEVIGARNHAQAYDFLLGRPVDTQDWIEGGIASRARFNTLDISEEGARKRREILRGNTMHDFNILKDGNDMLFQFRGLEHRVPVGHLHPLFQHTLLKMILNTHSTLMMGRMGKYEQNMMSFVNVLLNYKLVDRGARIVQEKFRREALPAPDYDRIVYKIFEMAAASTGPDDPPVPKAFSALKLEMTS